MGAKWRIKKVPLPVAGGQIRSVWIAFAPTSRDVFENKFASQPEALEYVNDQLNAGALAEATA
ncbi:MAG: hypothetical protein ACOH14_06300 [Rhodoglobus sp.]